MAPTSKCSFRAAGIDKQINILNKRASQLAAKQIHASLKALLKQRPELLPDIWHHLAGKGVNVEKEMASVLPKKKARTDSKDNTKNDEAGLQKDKASKRKLVVDKDLKNWVPHCYRTLDATRPPILEKLAPALEEIAFSNHNLKALWKVKTSRRHYREMLLEILEYDTGYDVSMPLTGELRHIPTLISHLQNMRDQRKYRGSNLRLPPNWHSSGDGVFTLKKIDENKIFVVNKFTSDQRLLPDSCMISHLGSVICFSDLHIFNNFSEVRASIGSKTTADTIAIASLPVTSEEGSN